MRGGPSTSLGDHAASMGASRERGPPPQYVAFQPYTWESTQCIWRASRVAWRATMRNWEATCRMRGGQTYCVDGQVRQFVGGQTGNVEGHAKNGRPISWAQKAIGWPRFVAPRHPSKMGPQIALRGRPCSVMWTATHSCGRPKWTVMGVAGRPR